MKNLKRALSFALASVMVIGMMVVGAGAADFTDADKIVNEEAVNTLVTLGVISGKEDGSYFDPTGIVTRAEMAKMITVALNGGKDPVLGTSNTPTYSDIKGTWAESYIEYCSNLGIIAGKGDGTFAPTAAVTGTEAAKMILVAMGYDAEAEGFVGATWAIATNSKASAKGLYKDLESIDPNAGLTRDNAAQMIWNGIQALMVKYEYKLVTNNGTLNSVAVAEDDSKSILSSKFGMDVIDAVVEGIDYNEDKGEYTYDLGNFNYTTEDDYTDLFRLPVKVLYKVTGYAVASKDIYGIYTDADKIVEGVIGKVDSFANTATEVKIDSVKYKLDNAASATSVYEYNVADAGIKMSDIANANEYDTFAAYDTDEDGKIDLVVWYPVSFTKVTFANKTSFTTSTKIDGNSSHKYEDVETNGQTFAKNDYVVVTAKANTAKGITEFVKAETVTGKVTGQKSGQYQIDGTWYKTAATLMTGSETIALGDTVELVVLNGYYVYAEKTTSTTTDMLVVTKIGDKNSLTDNYPAKVVFTDGTTATVDVNINASKNTLYTYELDDGVYELTPATTDNTGYDFRSTSTFVAKADKLEDGTRIADDAVVIVVYGNAKTKVITGAALKTWNKSFGDTAEAYGNKTNGFKTAEVVLLVDRATSIPSTGDDIYGYITSTPYAGKEGDDYYVYFTVWTENGSMDVKDKVATASFDTAIYAKKNIVTFTDEGDGIVDDTKLVENLYTAAVVAWDGTYATVKTTAGGSNTFEVTDDTVMVYIDTEDVEGVDGGEMDMAKETAANTYAPNIFYARNDENEFTVIFVDVNNEIDGADTVNYAG